MRERVSFRCELISGRYQLWLKNPRSTHTEYVSRAFLEKLINRLRGSKSLVKVHKFRTHMDEKARHNMANVLEEALR